MPMNTTFETRRPPSPARRAARTTCSTISPVVRWRSKPAWPVAQKPHAMAQPAWLETQTVARSGYSISTVSTRAPPASAHSSLTVSPRSLSCSRTSCSAGGSASARRLRSAAGAGGRGAAGGPGAPGGGGGAPPAGGAPPVPRRAPATPARRDSSARPPAVRPAPGATRRSGWSPGELLVVGHAAAQDIEAGGPERFVAHVDAEAAAELGGIGQAHRCQQAVVPVTEPLRIALVLGEQPQAEEEAVRVGPVVEVAAVVVGLHRPHVRVQRGLVEAVAVGLALGAGHELAQLGRGQGAVAAP